MMMSGMPESLVRYFRSQRSSDRHIYRSRRCGEEFCASARQTTSAPTELPSRLHIRYLSKTIPKAWTGIRAPEIVNCIRTTGLSVSRGVRRRLWRPTRNIQVNAWCIGERRLQRIRGQPSSRRQKRCQDSYGRPFPVVDRCQ